LPLLWLLVSHAIARVGGWRRFAEAHPLRGHGSASGGAVLRFQSAQLRHATNYNGCLTFVASPWSLRVSVLPIFPAHPPFEVPWGEIEVAAEGGRWPSAAGPRRVTLRFARTPEVPMHVTRRLAERLAAASAGALRLEPDAGAARAI